jgi:hypothetical protein
VEVEVGEGVRVRVGFGIGVGLVGVKTISVGERPAAAHLLRSGFESHRGHVYLSVVRVVCCQVEVSATS